MTIKFLNRATPDASRILYTRYEAKILSPVLLMQATESASPRVLFGATTSKVQFLDKNFLILRIGNLLLLHG